MKADEFLNRFYPSVATSSQLEVDVPDIMEAYAGHSEQAKWVSVDERLPEAMADDHQSELVLVTDGNMQAVTYYTHRHECWLYASLVGKITHWRPLPGNPVG